MLRTRRKLELSSISYKQPTTLYNEHQIQATNYTTKQLHSQNQENTKQSEMNTGFDLFHISFLSEGGEKADER